MVCRFPAADFLNRTAVSVLNSPSIEPPACFDDDQAIAFWFGVQDGPETIRSDGFARMISNLFGFVPTTSLPNEHLECIRRLTVCLNCGLAAQAIEESRRAQRHGVAAEQIISLIGSFHGPAIGSLCMAL
jgi:hypothetical protein